MKTAAHKTTRNTNISDFIAVFICMSVGIVITAPYAACYVSSSFLLYFYTT
jgi:hypothetical protein